jgi:DNA-binding transcriptional LysR family regulator
VDREKLEEVSLRDLRLFSLLYRKVKEGLNLEQVGALAEWKGGTVRNFLGTLEKKLRAAGILAPEAELVLRRGGGTTEAGDDFFAYAFNVLGAHDQAAAEHEDRRQTLHVWAEPTAATYILPRLLRDYLPRSDYRHVRVTERSAPEIVDAVHQGMANLGLGVNQPRHERIEQVRADALYEFSRLLVACRGSPLGGNVQAGRLARECLITFPASDLRQLGIAERLPQPGPRGVRVYLDSTQTILEWVRLGLGVGMGTTVQVMLEDVQAVTLSGQPELVRDRVMLYSARGEATPQLERVREEMLKAARRIWRAPPDVQGDAPA